MQTDFLRYRWIELLMFLEKEKLVNLLCDQYCFNYFVIYWVKNSGSIALIMF